MPGPWKERQGWAIGFEVPEIDSSGLVGLAAIGFEVREIDSSGLFCLAAIVFEVPEIDSSGLVGLAVLGRLSSRPPGVRRFSSVPGAWSGIVAAGSSPKEPDRRRPHKVDRSERRL